MKKLPFFILAGALALAVSCKQGEEKTEEIEASSVDASAMADSLPQSSAQRQFIRTADFRFKVRDVSQSVRKIEKTLTAMGGFVEESNQSRTVLAVRTNRFNSDSLVKTSRFEVANTMRLRVPSTKLDTLMQSVQGEAIILDSRRISAQDVHLDLVSAQMTRDRNSGYRDRLKTAVDTKGKRVGEIVKAEKDIVQSQASSDQARITHLDLRDQVAYSTVAIALYQNEQVLREIVADTEHLDYRTPFWTQFGASLETGWHIFQDIVLFFLKFWFIWPIVLFIVFYFRKPRKPLPNLIN